MSGSTYIPPAGTTVPSVSTLSAKPIEVLPVATKLAKSVIKVATSNLFNLGEPPTNPDTLTNLLFEDIGGQDIINVLRTDTVNGASFKNNMIVNLTSINQNYSPLTLITLSKDQAGYFKSFPYNLLSYIPDPATDLGYTVGQDVSIAQYPVSADPTTHLPQQYYVDPKTGDVIFYFVNLTEEHLVEFEFIQSNNNKKTTRGNVSA
ncbi:hypothetical protein UFOVP222_46 [uncultured Caudovirales phage]|uniref:Uncharacterized protein n=1 Tax=uncultured Caudovirales phage TaxID=2100421 RepID=A0A6J7WN03_9CAUD|nr:hypothetical protein UFOVP108_41 [uncultured Caudovirales phage]CAB5219256.1 hypothetical protein UFOVP222_46 [uncultured Caudovirales phage]